MSPVHRVPGPSAIGNRYRTSKDPLARAGRTASVGTGNYERSAFAVSDPPEGGPHDG